MFGRPGEISPPNADYSAKPSSDVGACADCIHLEDVGGEFLLEMGENLLSIIGNLSTSKVVSLVK
jgi:hypothetical protein